MNTFCSGHGQVAPGTFLSTDVITGDKFCLGCLRVLTGSPPTGTASAMRSVASGVEPRFELQRRPKTDPSAIKKFKEMWK